MSNLENKLWDIIDTVRGYKDMRDLKDIYISLLFLKYANDKFIPNGYNHIEVPDCARWEYLYSEIHKFNFDKVLWKAFNAIEKENEFIHNTFSQFDLKHKFIVKKISPVFKTINTILEKGDLDSGFAKVSGPIKTNEVEYSTDLHILRHLFAGISKIALKLEFSDIIGELLTNFANYEGKIGSDFTTPNSVSQLMIDLINPEQGSILDSTCGIGGFFQQIENNHPNGKFKFYGQEYNVSTLAIAKLRFAFNHKNSIEFGEPNNTLVNDEFPDLKADYVLMHPPFNVKSWMNEYSQEDPRFVLGLPPKTNANLAWVQHAIHHLNDNGKAAILLSNGSLSTGGKEAEIRKNLIEKDLVESIITLPSQMLSNTSISSSIWLLNKQKLNKKAVLFIDASNFGQKMSYRAQNILDAKSIKQITSVFRNWQERKSIFAGHFGFFQSVSLEEIVKNDYILTPGRYVGINEMEGVDLSKAITLGSILENIKPKKLGQAVSYKKVSIRNLSSNPDAYFLDTESLTEGGLSSNYRLLPDNVLLIPRLGDKLKFSFHKESDIQIAYSANSIFTFKVDTTKVNLDYLIAELCKKYIGFQFSAFKFGAGIQLIRLKDLLNIKILIPDLLEQQKQIFENERELRFQSLAKELGFQKELGLIKQAQMKDLGSKKHNIMQHLNNVKASTDVLIKMMELNNGVLKSDAIIDPRRGVTVEKRFLRLQESLDKVIYYVDNITNELKYDDAEIIDAFKFLKECKERGIQNELFSVELIVEKQTFQGRNPLISISMNDFEEIYNNILENAINHGFVDKSKSYIFRITIAYINGFLEINFENNGKAFPKGIAEKFEVKGEKAGATAGSGIGLWKVAEIAKHFDSKLEVYDEPSSEFPVGFKFQFNLETL